MRLVWTSIVPLLLASWAAGQGPPATETLRETNTCVSCHATLGGELGAPAVGVEAGAHGLRTLSCAGCHGGDPTQEDPGKAMDPRQGFVGRPPPRAIPRFCGKCHSDPVFMKRFNPSLRVDQEAEYFTSVHGRRLKEGDMKVATCISCHGHHGILPVKNPNARVFPTRVAQTCGACHANADYMRPYSIPTDQMAQYNRSVHADALLKKQDLSAPTCNDCHGNHGAAPPGVESIANVCGTCHVRQADFFRGSPHQEPFETMKIAGCVTCHGNHQVEGATDTLLGVGKQAVCIRCHVPGDRGYQAAEKMRASIDRLSDGVGQARLILGRAASAGMEVSRPLFELKGAESDLVHARVVVHSFSAGRLEQVVAPGLEIARKAQQEGQDALHEFDVRRLGLGASLVVILLAVIGIYQKVRQMEARGQ